MAPLRSVAGESQEEAVLGLLSAAGPAAVLHCRRHHDVQIVEP